mmetsp:Transcript_348/g.1218  ORF Transcript_348/g.1218 Transcript_348/m.1218 type:complete len:217 (+) Transcript_348:2674-3324(+)
MRATSMRQSCCKRRGRMCSMKLTMRPSTCPPESSCSSWYQAPDSYWLTATSVLLRTKHLNSAAPSKGTYLRTAMTRRSTDSSGLIPIIASSMCRCRSSKLTLFLGVFGRSASVHSRAPDPSSTDTSSLLMRWLEMSSCRACAPDFTHRARFRLSRKAMSWPFLSSSARHCSLRRSTRSVLRFPAKSATSFALCMPSLTNAFPPAPFTASPSRSSRA